MIITDKAKVFITDLMKDNGVSTLRFTFEGAGCCGPNYGITLEQAQENDITKVVNGIQVAMDPKVIDIVNTLTLDYEEDEQEGAGLVVSGGSSCC